jgi:hypothetical protein
MGLRNCNCSRIDIKIPIVFLPDIILFSLPNQSLISFLKTAGAKATSRLKNFAALRPLMEKVAELPVGAELEKAM